MTSDHSGDGRPAMSDPRNQFLVDFIYTEPEAAEGFRLRYCAICRATAESGAGDDERQAHCDRHRCGLRDPDRLRAEQEWAMTSYLTLCDRDQRSPEALAAFNARLAWAGCVSFGLTIEDDNRLMLGFKTATLRGALHYCLLETLGALDGIVIHNARTMTGTEARAEVGRIHELLEAHESRARRRRAAELRDQDFSDNQIATILGCTPGAIRHWLGAREEWPQRREGWWQAQKG